MKNCFTLFLFLLLNSLVLPQGRAQLGWQWGIHTTSLSSLASWAPAATDAEGNVYHGSWWVYGDSVTLGGFLVWNPEHKQQLVISKTDTAGTVHWIVSTQHANVALVSMVTNAAGCLYVFAKYDDTLLTIGSTTLTAPANRYMYFIAKISPSGTLMWAKNVAAIDPGFVLNYELFGGLGLDVAGNAYVVEPFTDHDITIGTTTLYNSAGYSGTYDIYMAKYDSSGGFLWAKSYGTIGQERPYAFAVAKSGNFYIFGDHQSTLPLTIDGTTLSDSSYYLAKFNSNGNLIWAYNEPGGHYMTIMRADENENIYTAGMVPLYPLVFASDTVAGPVALVKYDSAGNAVWGRGISGNLNDNQISSLSLDHIGNVVIGGEMNGAGPTPGYILNISGHSLAEPADSKFPSFVAAYDTAGVYKWSTALISGGSGNFSMVTDAFGCFYAEGSYYYGPGMMVFGPDTMYNLGGNPLFIARSRYDTTITTPTLGMGALAISHELIDVFPNPASSSISVASEKSINTLTIGNMLGQTVYRCEYNTNKLMVNVADLPAGTYMVRINNGPVRKFVKL